MSDHNDYDLSSPQLDQDFAFIRDELFGRIGRTKSLRTEHGGPDPISFARELYEALMETPADQVITDLALLFEMLTRPDEDLPPV